VSDVSYKTLLLIFVAFSVNAQQPPDIVHSDAYFNTAMGDNALLNLTPFGTPGGPGSSNTATGYSTLEETTTGFENTANGSLALNKNVTGGDNTAVGFSALQFNISGHDNTAVGNHALWENQTGVYNTATGSHALESSVNANDNNAYGAFALSNNLGNDNNAVGYMALYSNTTGSLNNASGNFALRSNTTGNNNNAIGYAALYRNETGSSNNAQGFYALQNIVNGSNNNIAVGQYAGSALVQGSNNVYIGSPGAEEENAVIRIGNPATHIAAYMAGIQNAHITGAAVYVTAAGQLGVLASSERYKTEIKSIRSTAKLEQLRPVAFHLQADPGGNVQYGLIAEEVDKVYPELVIHGADGKIEGVRYDELAPMLLRKVQNQAKTIREMQLQVTELKKLNQSVLAVLTKIRTSEQSAQR
jgi:hypothetical protein